MKFNASINTLTSNFIFIGGVSRSGKSFLCPIVSSFKKTEMFMINTLAENISYANRLKQMNKGISEYLIKLTLNEHVYNLNIGRNVNLRKRDYSSIYNHSNSKMYLKRMHSKDEGDILIKKILKQNHFYPVMFHDVLINPKILLDCYQNAKIIYIDRHPIELINEWILKKYSSSFWKSPRSNTLAFKVNENFYPYWSLKKVGLIDASKNEIEKTVFSLGSLLIQQKKNFRVLGKKYKKKILIVKFDDLVSETDSQINKICKFINAEQSNFTNKVIKKEKGNRIINYSTRNKLRSEYLKNMNLVSKNFYFKLERMYEKK